jgi:hypothetical protein
MSKTLYIYDQTKRDYHTDVVADDYALQANETFVQPVGADGTGIKLPVSFDGTHWIEATDDEHKKYLAANIDSEGQTSLPYTDKAISELTLLIAQNKADQDTVNAQLLLATAQQTAKETI